MCVARGRFGVGTSRIMVDGEGSRKSIRSGMKHRAASRKKSSRLVSEHRTSRKQSNRLDRGRKLEWHSVKVQGYFVAHLQK